MSRLPPQSVIDARYRAKLDARATGATPVMVEVPPDTSPENLDAKVREKLARHRSQAKAAASAKTAAPATAPEPRQVAESEKPPEPKPQQGHGGGEHRHDRRR